MHLPALLATTAPDEEGSGAVTEAALPSDIVEASASTVLLYLLVGVVAAFVVGLLVTGVARRVGRRSAVVADVEQRARRPFRVLLVVVAARVVLEAATLQAGWAEPLAYVANLVIIAMVAWIVASAVFVLEDVTLSRYGTDVADNRRARRVQTQASLLRRLTVAIIVVFAVGAMLLTIPGAREYGATLFASAGVVGIVAGLAAQTSIANLFAGLQIAFTDGIRVDDVVVVEGEWGRIEEITLTYVVVHVWDDRRLILPSTYFTTTPFENWTRKDSQVMGTVMLDVDWSVPLEGLRAELDRVLAATDRWDGRVGLLQVMDAVGGAINLRVIVSAVDGPTLADLRAEVREALVVWMQVNAPDALPRSRVADVAGGATAAGRPVHEDREEPRLPVEQRTGPHPAPPAPPAPRRAGSADEQRPAPSTGETGLFTGSIAAVTRARDFQGPGESEMAERRAADAARSGDRDGADTADEPRSWRDELAADRDPAQR